MGMEIALNVTSQVALFVIKGRIGWEDSRILDQKISETINNGSRYIIFNLDEVVFLGSGGIGALVYHMKKVHNKGGDIYIVSNNDYIQYLFATIGFHIVFKDKIFKTFEEFQEKILSPKGIQLNPAEYVNEEIESKEKTNPKPTTNSWSPASR